MNNSDYYNINNYNTTIWTKVWAHPILNPQTVIWSWLPLAALTASIFPGKALYEILECLCEVLLIHPEEHLRSDTNVRQDSLALIIH